MGARCGPRPWLHFSTPCALRPLVQYVVAEEAVRRGREWRALPAAREQDRMRPGTRSCLRAGGVSRFCTYFAPCCRCGVAPQARRSGVPHMPLRLRGGADPSVCALPRAHVHPARANTLFSPTRPPERSAQPSALDCPARPSESDYQATLYVTAGVCASARRVPGPVPAKSARVPGPHTPRNLRRSPHI